MTKLWQKLLTQQDSALAPGATAYRYWQLYIYTNNGDAYTSICEISLRATPGGATLTNPSTPTIASSSYGAYGPSLSVDGKLGFYDVWIANGAANQSIAYDLLTPVVLRELAIFPSGSTSKRNPKNFVVRGSNVSMSGPWTDVKTFDEVNLSTTWKTYSLD